MTSRSFARFRPGSNAPKPKPLTSFHRFKSLPPELRLIVWENAFKSIAYDNPREWELVLLDAPNGGAVVIESGREDTPFDSGLFRDRYIRNLRLVCYEANDVFKRHIAKEKIFTLAPMAYRWSRDSLVSGPEAKAWLCPEYDCWMFNFEFNSIGNPQGVGMLPVFEEWKDDLEGGRNQRIIDSSRTVLDSIRHLRIGFQALAGYTEHDLDAFLASLPQLSRISIHLEPIPWDEVPGRFHEMADVRWGGRDFAYENRHVAAHCFFERLADFDFTDGIVEVPESVTRDIEVPDKAVLNSFDYIKLVYDIYDDISTATLPDEWFGNGIQRREYVEFIERWVALGDRGVERVLVTHVTSARSLYEQPHWLRRSGLQRSRTSSCPTSSHAWR